MKKLKIGVIIVMALVILVGSFVTYQVRVASAVCTF